MKKRFLAMLAVLALGLVPALAVAGDPPPADPSAPPSVLVKAYSMVTAVTDTSVEIDVIEAHDWLDGTETYNLSTGINGQRIVVGMTAETMVLKNGMPAERSQLAPGMKIKAYLTTDVQPVTTANVFTATKLAFEVPKPHPGKKFETGFFPRLWHTRGKVLGFSEWEGMNVLNLDVRRLDNTPKRFRDERVRLINMDAYVIVPPKVVITDDNGRRIAFSDLTVDSRIKVVGKFLRPVKWLNDETGEPTPTLLARRIKVTQPAPAPAPESNPGDGRE